MRQPRHHARRPEEGLFVIYGCLGSSAGGFKGRLGSPVPTGLGNASFRYPGRADQQSRADRPARRRRRSRGHARRRFRGGAAVAAERPELAGEESLRRWQEIIDTPQLAIAVTHHDSPGNGVGSLSHAAKMLALADNQGITGVLTNMVRMSRPASRSNRRCIGLSPPAGPPRKALMSIGATPRDISSQARRWEPCSLTRWRCMRAAVKPAAEDCSAPDPGVGGSLHPRSSSRSRLGRDSPAGELSGA